MKLYNVLLTVVAVFFVLVSLFTSVSCIPQHRSAEAPMVPRPLLTDDNEIHWRMYYQDQFNNFGQAPPPPPDAPHVAWTAYWAERQVYDIRVIRDGVRRMKQDSDWGEVRENFRFMGGMYEKSAETWKGMADDFSKQVDQFTK